MFAVACLSFGLARAGAAEGTGLSVETGSPDALCPDLSTTREAIGRRLGTLVAPPGAGWKARYTIGHAPEGTPRDFVRLELFGPDGALQLSRDLPLDASCAIMADVIALVLDRHFRGIPAHDPQPAALPFAALPPAALPPTLPLAAPLPPSGPPAAPPSAIEPLDVAPPPAPTADELPPPSLLLGAEVSARFPFAPRLGLHVLGALGPTTLGLAASSALTPEREQLDRGGNVEVMGLALHGHAGWGPEWDRVRTYIGPSLRLSLERGSAHGLPEVDTRYRWVSGIGAQAGAVAFVDERWFVMLTGTVDYTLEALSGRFVIDGREVLAPSAIQGWMALGVGYAL